MKAFASKLLALIMASGAVSAFATENQADQSPAQNFVVNKAQIQSELNDKWAIPLQRGFTAYRCGYSAQGDQIAKDMANASSDVTRNSVISYGFVLGYAEYLESLVYRTEDRPEICDSFIKAGNALGQPNDTASFEKTSTSTAIESLIKASGLKDSLGTNRINDLLISTQAIKHQYGLALNKSVLMEACNAPQAGVGLPTALDVINAAKMIGEANQQKIKDAIDVWFGFSQGTYWHALNLVNKSPDRATVCQHLDLLDK